MCCVTCRSHGGCTEGIAVRPGHMVAGSQHSHPVSPCTDARAETAQAKRTGGKLKASFSVLVTTYELCMLDSHFLSRFDWSLCVVDEAHRLKSQISKLCKAVLVREWQVPTHEVNVFFESSGLAIDGWRLFAGVVGSSWQAASGVTGDTYPEWVRLRNQLTHGRATAPKQQLEEGCIILCEIIAALAAWGKSQPINYDGLVHLDTIGLPTYKSADGSITERLEEGEADVADFSTKRWKRFKAKIKKSGVGKKEE